MFMKMRIAPCYQHEARANNDSQPLEITDMYDASIILKTIVLQTNTRKLSALQDQLSCSNAKILELEELLTDAHDTIRRLRDGDAVEWGEV